MCEKTIVVDNGSGFIYAGFAEEDDPVVTFPNIMGLNKTNGSKQVNFTDISTSHKYEQLTRSIKNGETKVSYPMQHGVITDWDAMETVWNYTFLEGLGSQPEECNLLITEPVMNPKANREKMAQILFEKFNFPAIYVAQSSTLPLYGFGLTTGVVLDIGHGVCQALPVWGGYPITEAIHRADFGGNDVSLLLGRLLKEKGFGSKPLEVIHFIKESTAYTSEQANPVIKDPEMSFTLPDGEVLKLGDERYQCTELLFNPSLFADTDQAGVHEMLYKSIMKTNMDIRKDLYGNIVLSGGSTLAPGFVERLSKEIQALLPPKAKLTIRAPPERRYANWKGGSVLASLSNFSRLLISQNEFFEVGPSIMHKDK